MPSLPVLAYHSVGPRAKLSAACFEGHLRVLSNARVLGPSLFPCDLQTARRGFLLTFDDGFADLWTHGLDLLSRYDVRGVVFVIPSRAGEGGPRPQGAVAWEGRERDAHAEASVSGGPHPAFLRWSEMSALEATGRIRIESHSLHHRQGWIGDRPTGFHLGDTTHWGLAQANGGDERMGVPVFPRGSALAHRLFVDHPGVRDDLFGWFDARGGLSYLAERGARRVTCELLRRWQQLTRNGADAGRWETDGERESRVLEELAGSRALLERRLGGRRVEFCLPWGEYDDITLRFARHAGYERVYTLRRRPNPTGAIEFLVHRFEPRARGGGWLRSRLWIYRSTWRTRVYGGMGGRA